MTQTSQLTDPNPTQHLTNVSAAYRAISEARVTDMEYVNYTSGDEVEPLNVGGSIWGPTGTFTPIWESPFASRGSQFSEYGSFD